MAKIKRIWAREIIGSRIMGRYWAMDRDRRWERTERAYNALTKAKGHLVKTVEEAIEQSYELCCS